MIYHLIKGIASWSSYKYIKEGHNWPVFVCREVNEGKLILTSHGLTELYEIMTKKSTRYPSNINC